MTSQYKNPRLLILGGALEYQRVPNQLASFDTLLQQVLSFCADLLLLRIKSLVIIKERIKSFWFSFYVSS